MTLEPEMADLSGLLGGSAKPGQFYHGGPAQAAYGNGSGIVPSLNGQPASSVAEGAAAAANGYNGAAAYAALGASRSPVYSGGPPGAQHLPANGGINPNQGQPGAMPMMAAAAMPGGNGAPPHLFAGGAPLPPNGAPNNNGARNGGANGMPSGANKPPAPQQLQLPQMGMPPSAGQPGMMNGFAPRGPPPQPGLGMVGPGSPQMRPPGAGGYGVQGVPQAPGSPRAGGPPPPPPFGPGGPQMMGGPPQGVYPAFAMQGAMQEQMVMQQMAAAAAAAQGGGPSAVLNGVNGGIGGDPSAQGNPAAAMMAMQFRHVALSDIRNPAMLAGLGMPPNGAALAGALGPGMAAMAGGPPAAAMMAAAAGYPGMQVPGQPNVLGPSRAIFVSQVPETVSYEEMFDAVGAFGNLESIKMIPDKHHAFVNYIDAGSAFALMTSCGGELILHGKPSPMTWARTRPVPRDLYAAIRSGATRNLYVANVPESLSEQGLFALFGRFGELESIRLVPRKLAAFVNYVSVSCAIRAKDAMHFKHPNPKDCNGLLTEVALKPLLINFTSAQQNCMRARGGRHAAWGGGPGGGQGESPNSGSFGRREPRGMGERGMGERGRGLGGAGRGRAEARPGIELPTRSRALYLGSVPEAAGLEDLASLIESMAIIESLRLVRPKSCAFINLCNEEVAQALHAKFTTENGANAPEIHGKRLTVNFAKARPCADEQLNLIANGARRRLRILVPEGYGVDEFKAAMGTKSESVLAVADEGLTPEDEELLLSTKMAAAAVEAEAPAAAPASEDADAAEGGVSGAPAAAKPSAEPATHALVASFSSVTAAIAAKADLDKVACLVSYVANTVLSEEELEALLEAAKEAEEAAALNNTAVLVGDDGVIVDGEEEMMDNNYDDDGVVVAIGEQEAVALDAMETPATVEGGSGHSLNEYGEVTTGGGE